MYTLILNPISGNGGAAALRGAIEEVLKAEGIGYTVRETTRVGDATCIAREAVQNGSDGVIAAGGDGTLFEVINGMAKSELPLLFVPCGTGNDFVKVLPLPKDPIEALRVQLKAPVSAIDVGRMNDLFFLNVAGTGFDVDVLKSSLKFKDKHKGLMAYLLGLIDALKHYKPMRAEISVNDGPFEERRFAILSIGNGRFIGGGMKAVPDALKDDGLFDLVVVKPVRKWMIPVLLAFFITGKHVAVKLAAAARCTKFRIRAKGMTVNLDGELRDTDEAEFELLPQALRVRLPKG